LLGILLLGVTLGAPSTGEVDQIPPYGSEASSISDYRIRKED